MPTPPTPMPADVFVDQGLDKLRERGCKITPQRKAILRLFGERGGHLTAPEIHAMLAGHVASLSRATVYNTLELLEDVGLLARVHSADGHTYYDANIDAHHHAQCVECGQIFDLYLPEAPLHQLLDQSAMTTSPAQEGALHVHEATLWLRIRCERCKP